MLKAGAVGIRDSDGKFFAKVQPAYDTPWVHIKSSYRTNCYLWKEITFDHIVKKYLPLQDWFVPAGCQECFKVVVKPKTLEQLFALFALEKKLNHPSKCGIEIRDSVFGNYGGYFYNRGLQEGLDCYKMVRYEVSQDPKLGPDIVVLLKRGCTEMEHSIGQSDKWEITEAQINFEMRLSQLFVNDISVVVQSDHAQNEVRQRWIERAYSIGDETALLYNNGQPLYPDYVTYQHLLIKKEEDNVKG
jgi:hypothetical protein